MKRTDWILLAVVALASGAFCVTSWRHLGATFDEPFYLESGLDYWRNGHFGRLLAAGTMPLAPNLQTLPIYVVERTTGRLLTPESNLEEMLRLARPVTLLFWLVLLGFTMKLGRLWGGPWGGRAAVLLIALEPNFLAHASLATTDIALAACWAGFAAEFLANRHERGFRRVVVPAIWLGLAITAKVSALALLPYAVIAALLYERHDRIAGRRVAVDTIVMLAIGLAFALVYCGTGGQTWLHGTLASMPSSHGLRPLVAWLGALPLFPNALYAIWFQLAHNTTGQAVYVAGLASTQNIWFYVPLLLLIKLSLPLLAVIALAMASGPSRRVVLAAVALLIMTMLLFRVQTGIRFLLPLLVMVIAWVASHASMIVTRPRTVRLAIAASIVVMTIEVVGAWPDALRYVNEAWGGPDGGYRVVSDSNYDWGQGLPALDRWRRADGREMAVWYFGTDTRFPEIIRYDPRRTDIDPQGVRGRVLAVSVSLLHGGYLETPGPGKVLIDRLRATTPIARTPTFAIFDAAVRREAVRPGGPETRPD